MTFQSVPNAVEAVLNATIASKPIANVLGFQFSGAYGQSDLDALASAIDSQIGGTLLTYMPSALTYNNVHVRGLTNIIDLESTDGSSTGAGADTAEPLPSQCTLCITLRTGQTGRSARGRFYTWPATQGQTTASNTFSSGYAAGILAFLSNTIAVAAGLGWNLSVISRVNEGVVRPVGVTYRVTAVVARNLRVDTQRRRLPGPK
jgi:hypothetical protein